MGKHTVMQVSINLCFCNLENAHLFTNSSEEVKQVYQTMRIDINIECFTVCVAMMMHPNDDKRWNSNYENIFQPNNKI